MSIEKSRWKFWTFSRSDRTSFVPKNKGKCKFKAKIIYYWINLPKSKLKGIIIFFIGQFDLIVGQFKA